MSSMLVSLPIYGWILREPIRIGSYNRTQLNGYLRHLRYQRNPDAFLAHRTRRYAQPRPFGG